VEEVCIYTLMSSLNKGDSKGAANAKKMTDDILWHAEQAMYQAQQDWVAAARVALDKNRSTFAVLSLAEIFSPDGHLEKLKELGYTVEEPAQVSTN
jgi:flavin-binding protein dodecin